VNTNKRSAMKLFLSLFLFAVTTSFVSAADFTMTHGRSSTVFVEGCARSEVGVVTIKSSMSGNQQLTSRCLPVYCAYSNERSVTWFGTEWTIKLLARDTMRDSRGVFKGDPQFDRSFGKVLHKGVTSEQERDALIKGYLRDGTCKGVYFDQNVPAV